MEKKNVKDKKEDKKVKKEVEKKEAEKKEVEKKENEKKKTEKKDIEKKTINKDSVKKEKVDVTKKENNKAKNIFSKSSTWVIIAVTLILIVAASAGIVFFIKSPYFAVMKTFNSIKKGNITSVNKYVSYEEIMNSLVIGLDLGENTEEIQKKCFDDLKYKINKVEVNNDTATVKVEATNKNFRNALAKLTQIIMQKVINNEETTNEQRITILNECLSDSFIGTMTVNKDITLNRVEGNWRIIINDDFKDALFPGQSEVVNSIDALIKE